MRVAIHEEVDKDGGVVFRCTFSGSATDRSLEVPTPLQPGLKHIACVGNASTAQVLLQVAPAHVCFAKAVMINLAIFDDKIRGTLDEVPKEF